MRKIFVLVCIVLASLYAHGQQTFRSLGVATQVFQGANYAHEFYLPIPQDKNIVGGTLVLEIEQSELLNLAKSTISIAINDLVARSTTFTNQKLSKFILPLDERFNTTGRFLKITIKSHLFIGNDVCPDENNIGLWIKVLSSSYLKLKNNPKYGLSSINLSNTIYTKKAIVYPESISPKELQYLSLIYTKLKRLPIDDIQLFKTNEIPDTLSDFVYVGLKSKLPQNIATSFGQRLMSGEGILYLNKFVKNRKIHQNLYITADDLNGLEKATNAFLAPEVLNSCFETELVVRKANSIKSVKSNRLPLIKFNGMSTAANQGKFNRIYKFKTSAFDALPMELTCQFQIKHTSFNVEDHAYLNLYINDVLFASKPLNESGSLVVEASINSYQLKKFNTLRAEFSFYPAEGFCTGKSKDFTGQIDDYNSYLEVSKELPKGNLNFYSFPDVFQKETVVLVDRAVFPKTISTVVNLVSHISDGYDKESVYPILVDYADNLKKYGGYKIIYIGSPTDGSFAEKPINIPLTFDNLFERFGKQDSIISFDVSANKNAIVTQIFKRKENPIILSLTTIKDGFVDSLGVMAVSHLNKQSDVFAGNVMVSDQHNQYSFNVDLSGGVVNFNSVTWLLSFWSSYKFVLLFISLALVFLLYMYIRSKTNQSQELFKLKRQK